MLLYTGGYTADMNGTATGIGRLSAGEPEGQDAAGEVSYLGPIAQTRSPSWIAAHPSAPVLYAALEGEGAVQAFSRAGEASFTPLGEPVPTGELTCHVAVAPDASALVAACWGDGRVVRIPLDASGRPQRPQVAESALDPYAGAGDPDRVSRAHQSVFLPDGTVVTTDMGWDLVRFWRTSEQGLVATGQVVLPRGTGPRHMRVHPSGHLYVITELSQEVFVLATDREGRWQIVSASPLGDGLGPEDAGAELSATADGAFLHAGVRGSNTIATLRVRGDGSRLEPVAVVETGVNWPRHHVVVGSTLLVGGQLSNDVTSLTIDERTGVPGRVRHRADVPSPSCLLPRR